VNLLKIKELRELSNKELEGKIRESKKELFNLRMKQSTGTLEKPSKIRELRKDVARMKTIIRERELNEEVSDGE
jgi:large subunit ribosomal protein L29